MSILTRDSKQTERELESGDRLTELTGPGTLICVGCGFGLSIEALDALPTCPTCGGSRFRRGSIFDQPTVDVEAIEVATETPVWLEEARAKISQPGPHLAFEYEDEPTTVRIEGGWTRIGRSSTADVRLDDPTVSRRHALIVLTPEGELRALDDRSLNGLFVNGEQVEWSPLADGDELEIGRYRIFVIEP